jgi:hypothetical protein
MTCGYGPDVEQDYLETLHEDEEPQESQGLNSLTDAEIEAIALSLAGLSELSEVA